jgi:hypothetical protein
MEKTEAKSLSGQGVLGPSKSFVTLVDEALIARAEEEKKTRGSYPLRPSAAGYCSRKLAHDLSGWMGYSEKVWEYKKPSVLRLLSLGHSIEFQALKELALIQGFEVKFKQQVVEMFRLPSGRIIEGSVDSVMWSEEHKALLDVKSVGLRHHSAFGNTWNAMINKYDRMKSMMRFDENAWWIENPMDFMAEIGEDALVANIAQINLYACTKFMQDRGVTVGVVYRYSKANSELMEIRFKPSMELFNKIQVKYSLIEEKVNAKAIEDVPKDFVLGSLACAFCPYASTCWPHKDAKKEYFKTFPKKIWPESISNLDAKQELSELFNKLAVLEDHSTNKSVVESTILLHMENSQVDKIQLDNGAIYQRVFLKSPRPHFELRRVNE